MGPRYDRSDRGNQPPRQSFQRPTDDEIKKIIVDGDAELLVAVADRVGKTLVEQRLTTNQIRNVFGTVRQIQMRWPTDPVNSYRDAVLLRPKMAYFAEREKKTKGGTKGMETLQSVLEPALILLSEKGLADQPRHQRFEHFAELFEAIVAYHKKHEGDRS